MEVFIYLKSLFSIRGSSEKRKAEGTRKKITNWIFWFFIKGLINVKHTFQLMLMLISALKVIKKDCDKNVTVIFKGKKSTGFILTLNI